MHSLFIITAGVKDWFNQQAEALGNNGVAVASLALSASGNEPGTHGWCAVKLSAATEQAVTDLLNANPDKAAQIWWTQYDLSANPTHPQTQLVARGLKVISKPLP
jgi:hypothetical protein